MCETKLLLCIRQDYYGRWEVVGVPKHTTVKLAPVDYAQAIGIVETIVKSEVTRLDKVFLANVSVRPYDQTTFVHWKVYYNGIRVQWIFHEVTRGGLVL